MRIRKRLSGCLPKQLPSYKYCFSTGWLRPRHEAANNTTRREVPDECKSLQHPIGEAIGEEPRTPPPCYGEKPALPRHRHEHQHHLHERKGGDEQEELHHRGGGDAPEQSPSSKKPRRRRRSRDPVKGESSSSQRKRVRVLQQQQHDHQLRDPAEAPNKNSSHENCGPPPRLDPNHQLGAKSISDQQEISRMDPLLRAMHTVVSEAGIEGLTARETAQQILIRGLCSEADIPRSVKMAKAMRESPYLVEISRSSKFVLWSTFLEESSKNQQQQEQEQQACRRRRRQRSGSRSNTGNSETGPEEHRIDENHQVDETGVAYQILELRMGGASTATPTQRDHHHHQKQQQMNGVIRSSPMSSPAPANSSGIRIGLSPAATEKCGMNSAPAPPPAQEPRKFFLDLNMAPQDDW